MIQSRYSVTVNAPIELVWQKLIDIKNWASWHPTLSNIHLVDTTIKSGLVFTYQYDKTKLKAEVLEVIPFKTFKFKATAKGVTGINTWTLEEKDGQVTVYDFEEMNGLIVWLFKKQFQKGLDVGMKNWLENFKSSFSNNENKIFPVFSGKTLSGVDVQTPEILLKKITFISVGFQIDEQLIIDYWSKNIVSRFNKNPNFNYLEFPIVSPKQAPNKYIQQFIDNQMRASISSNLHSNVVTIYEDYSLVLSKLGKTNYDGPYFFTSNSSGEILTFANDSKIGRAHV